MPKFLVIAAMLIVATPALAALDGSKLSPTDFARVDRQCDVLRFRQPTSLGSETPPPPPDGETPSDPSAYWADSADGMDEALSKINLSALTIQQCRDAGFYSN